MSSLVETPPNYRNLARALVARFLGRRPFPLVVLDRVLRARESKSASLPCALSVTFMATTHTAHCLAKLVSCFSNIQQRKLRTVRTPHVRFEKSIGWSAP